MTHLASEEQASACFLGVDGGGSKTLAILVDTQGQERGRGLAGSSNYSAIGLESAIRHLQDAIGQAIKMAGCQKPPKAAWFGLAGVDRPADQAILRPYLQPLAGTIRLTNDAELLLSALYESVGVALIAGTGAIALGRDRRGVIARASGWGHLLGDEGSGYDIGRQALQAAARAADGRGRLTTLLEQIMRQWNLEHPSDLLAQVYPDEDKAKTARLSALVFQAARAGDPVARNILQSAAGELALAALTVAAALDLPDGRLPLALGGGLLLHEPVFGRRVLQRIRHRQALGQVVTVEHPALSAARAAILAHSAERWGVPLVS